MLIFVFLIPIIFALVILVFFSKKAVWWEYLLLIVPSMLVSTMIYFGMVSYSESDTEYFGDYVTEIRYYQEWDEYIHKTCSYTTTSGSGKNQTTTTHYYDCSYVDNHPEEWKQVLSNGYEYGIPKSEYNRLFSMWKTTNTFIDMDRDYHRIDGDMYKKKFDGLREHSKTRTIECSYKNKIKASHSIFGFTIIKPEEAKKMGLYDYPQLTKQSDGSFFENDMNQSPFLGYKPTKDELHRWEFINGYYGVQKQFRTYVLFFYNKPLSIVQDQRSYWEGGNKNEMILCIGMDSVSNTIQWTDAFSWCDSPTFEVNFRSYMNGKDKLDLKGLADWTEYGARNYWKRKNFKDFDYINVELSSTQLMWLFIIILLFNIGMTIFIVLNGFEYNKNENGKYVNNTTNFKNNYRY